MNITAVNFTDGIRVDQATQKGSIYDVISVVTQKDNTHVTQTFARITRNNPELNPKCVKLRINGKGRGTPVADAATLVEVAWLCLGREATDFRCKGAETVCRMLGGDLGFVDEIQRRHAQVLGTAEEEFLLAGNSNSTQMALPKVPYTLEQLQQMQTAAASIAASKAEIQQCTVVLHEFPMAKYTQYIDLKGQETQLKQKDVNLNKEQLEIDSQRFGLRQKEDEHSLCMDRERAELEDRLAKRRRFDASTDDGITFRCLLAKAAEGVSDTKGFEEKAKQMSLGLEVYKAFKEQITGNHKPLHYNTAAADAIANFITDSVVANSKGTAKDLRSYFNAVPKANADTSDLYDNP